MGAHKNELPFKVYTIYKKLRHPKEDTISLKVQGTLRIVPKSDKSYVSVFEAVVNATL